MSEKISVKILIVGDDCDLTVEAIKQILNWNYYNTYCVGQKEELDSFLQENNDVRLIVLDSSFYSKIENWASLACEINQKKEDLPILLVCGYNQSVNMEEIDGINNLVGFLWKPVSMLELLEKVSDTINEFIINKVRKKSKPQNKRLPREKLCKEILDYGVEENIETFHVLKKILVDDLEWEYPSIRNPWTLENLGITVEDIERLYRKFSLNHAKNLLERVEKGDLSLMHCISRFIGVGRFDALREEVENYPCEIKDLSRKARLSEIKGILKRCYQNKRLEDIKTFFELMRQYNFNYKDVDITENEITKLIEEIGEKTKEDCRELLKF